MREYPGTLSHLAGAHFEEAFDRRLERLFFFLYSETVHDQ